LLLSYFHVTAFVDIELGRSDHNYEAITTPRV